METLKTKKVSIVLRFFNRLYVVGLLYQENFLS